VDTSKFLGKFKDATEDHLQRMNELLLRLEQDPSRPEEVAELLREIHTLKGESRMMGFGDMSDVSHAIEDVLKAQEAEGFATLADVSDELFDAFDFVQALMASKLGEPEPEASVEETCARLHALVGGEAPAAGTPATGTPDSAEGGFGDLDLGGDDFGGLDLGDLDLPDEGASLPDTPPVPDDGTAGMAEAFGIPEGVATEIEPGAEPPAPAKPGVSVGGGVSKFLGKFRDATLDHIQVMNRILLLLEQDPTRSGEISELMREIHTLKGEARMMGYGDMSDLAHAIEDVLRFQQEQGFATLSEVTDEIFEAFDAEEALLREKLGDGPAGVDVPALRARLEARAAGEEPPSAPKALVPAEAAGPAPVAAPEAAAATLEPIDPLMAEGFRESLSMQVSMIATVLESWKTDSSPRELERAVKGLETEAQLAGFLELKPLLSALSPACDAGRLDAARKALGELAALAADRVAGRDPAAAMKPLLDALEGRVEREEPKPPSGVGATASLKAEPAPAPTKPAAAAAKPAAKPAAPAKVDQTLRISLGKVEELGNLTGDIYLNHTRAVDRQRQLREMLEVASRQARAAGALRQAIGREASGGLAAGGELSESYELVLDTHRSLRRQLQEMLHADRDEYLQSTHQIVDLRERVRSLQMLPVSTLFDMYPRMVRDIAKELGKKVRLEIEGEGTELDRRVLDEIRDPMVHLIRNSIDHGVESPERREAAGKPAQGHVRLAARAEGDSVVIEIEDDGAGIDPGKLKAAAVAKGVISQQDADEIEDEQTLQLIFAPGFSSKEEVSDLSGRGVGMDVVRQKVESLEGRIGLHSEVGTGTRMTLRLPLTLAMARVLLLRAGGLLLAVPATFVAEVLRVPEESVRRVEAYEAIEWQGRTIPIVSLANVLERESLAVANSQRIVLVLGFEEHLVGFVLDALEGEREVVVKRMDEFIGRVKNVAGATILSSGQIVVVLHVPQLIASTMGVSPLSLRARLREPTATEDVAGRTKRLLVVDDSIIVRDMMKGVLEAAGFDVTVAVDGMDGLEKQLSGAHDLVITDVEMPRMNGFELTETLKQNEQQSEVPIIIVTTLDSAESKARGLQAGASAYVVKNLLDMSQLVETIDRLVS
jgi:two-component system chemotaxis sensor kinase CheA